MITSKEENNVLTVKEENGSYGLSLFFLVIALGLITYLAFIYDSSLSFSQNYKSKSSMIILAISILSLIYVLFSFFTVGLEIYNFNKNTNKFVYNSKWLFFATKTKEDLPLNSIKSVRVSPYQRYYRTVAIYYPVYLNLGKREIKMFGNQSNSPINPQEEAAKTIANFLKIPIKIEKLPKAI